jgi:branched-chain amino acid aminotransferase
VPIAIVIDGVPRAEHEATVSVLDRGFLFGDSVFEVMRTYGRIPFGEREHLERLARSAERMGFALPVSLEVLSAEIRDAIARSGELECYVRVVVTRGRGPLHIDPASARDPLRVVIAAPLAPLPAELYTRGVEVATVRVNRSTDHTRAAGAKVSAYAGNLLALSSARARGAYEAMMVGESGDITEGNSSNVFAIEKGVLRTPPISTGILPGVTRHFVLAAAADLGIPIREEVLFARNLERADEAFLTSSLRELVPIVRIDGVTIGQGTPGPITRMLHAKYREIVRARCEVV